MSVAEAPFVTFGSLPEGLDHLAAAAVEHNIFFEPAMLGPALHHLAPQGVDVLTAREPGDGKLLAAMPIFRMRGRYGPLPTPVPLGAWHHPYSMVGTPLLSRDDPEAAMITLLDAAQGLGVPTALLLPNAPADGAFWEVLTASCTKTSRRFEILASRQRAGLNRALAEITDTSFRDLVGQKATQSFKASKRKLAQHGTISTKTFQDAAELSQALDVFLTLEAQGWKGSQGTALRTAGHEPFVQEVVCNLAQEGRVRIDLTQVAGSEGTQTVAATLSIRAGSDDAPIWMPWKITYNEAFQKVGPGALSLGHLTTELLEEAQANALPLLLDSLADEDSLLANRLWQERWTFHDVLIDLTPHGSRGYGAILLAEKARQKARLSAKAARDTVKDAMRRTRST